MRGMSAAEMMIDPDLKVAPAGGSGPRSTALRHLLSVVLRMRANAAAVNKAARGREAVNRTLTGSIEASRQRLDGLTRQAREQEAVLSGIPPLAVRITELVSRFRSAFSDEDDGVPEAALPEAISNLASIEARTREHALMARTTRLLAFSASVEAARLGEQAAPMANVATQLQRLGLDLEDGTEGTLRDLRAMASDLAGYRALQASEADRQGDLLAMVAELMSALRALGDLVAPVGNMETSLSEGLVSRERLLTGFASELEEAAVHIRAAVEGSAANLALGGEAVQVLRSVLGRGAISGASPDEAPPDVDAMPSDARPDRSPASGPAASDPPRPGSTDGSGEASP